MTESTRHTMLSAMLVAGLGTVAKVEAPAVAGDTHPTYTIGSDRVHIHPTSMIGGQDAHLHHEYHWLVHHQKLRTTRIWLKDGTYATPIACALFGKELVSYPKEFIAVFGSPWQAIYASYRTGALLRQVRARVDKVVRRRLAGVVDPDEARVLELVQILCTMPKVE